VTGPFEVTAQRWRRLRPLRVLLDIADRALRADAADACENAGIAVVDAAAGEAADVILIDRPVETAIPAIVLAADGAGRSSPRSWPAPVCAVVPADTDADTLAAVITVAAAGYALTPRRGGAGSPGAGDDAEDAGGEDRWDDGGDEGAEHAGDWPLPGAAGSMLSSREREVLALLAAGASNKEIALALAVSVSTVKFHVAAITQKLGARSRVEAVAIAVRAGMVMI
jgi:DNA-binding NarL/FixJ family response regulator